MLCPVIYELKQMSLKMLLEIKKREMMKILNMNIKRKFILLKKLNSFSFIITT